MHKVICDGSKFSQENEMEREECSAGFMAIEDRFAGYQVHDRSGSKIGKVDDLFVDESGQPWRRCSPTSSPA